jgi:hypothetical protein
MGLVEQAGVHRRGIVRHVEERPPMGATEDLEAAVLVVRWIEGNH